MCFRCGSQARGTSLCRLKRAAESMVGGRRYKCMEAVVDIGAEERLWRLVGRFQDAHAQVPRAAQELATAQPVVLRFRMWDV